MSRLLTSTIGHTLCSSSSPVLPPPAAVLALALGHGGDLHAVAAIIGPWGSHGDVVLLWPCPATTCMLAMVAACMPWLLDTSFTRSLGFTVFFCSLRSNGFTTSGLQPWQFVYTQTLTFSVTRTLGWEAKQSGPYKYVRVWWCPLSTGSLPPSLWKEFPCHFLFLCAHQILTRTKLTWNQLLIFGGNNWYTKLHMFEFEEDVDSEFTAAFVEKLLNIC